jgi:hypothetical protein
MADALGVDDENLTKLLPVACRLRMQVALYIIHYNGARKREELRDSE